MARRTCNGSVRASQREYSLTVIEIRRRPRGRRVARLASRRETTLDMVRTGRLVEVVDMTRRAVGWCTGVFSAYVAGSAGYRDVRTGKRECCFAVVEACGRPCCRRMAGLARCWKTALDMVGAGRPVEVVDVARGAVRRGSCILSAHVAGSTRHRNMRTGQREPGQRVVIEFRIRPCHRAVTRLASGREPCLCVGRIVGSVVVLGVTTVAIGRRPLVLSADMACGALQRSVRTGEGKTIFRMIDLGAEPTIEIVALDTVCGKTRGHVVRLRALVGLCMAGNTIRRQSEVLSGGRALVTGLTVDCGMGPHQGKPVVVPLDGLDVDTPSLHGVALLALRTHLPAMDIRVTVGALGSGVAEYQARVALPAGYIFVKTAQGILRLVMIELRNIADRLPRCECMTVLAGHV